MSHVEAIQARRGSDSGFSRITRSGERIAQWIAILGVVGALSVFYTRVKDLVANAPEMEKRVVSLETNKAVTDERWHRVEQWMEKLDNKVDRLQRR